MKTAGDEQSQLPDSKQDSNRDSNRDSRSSNTNNASDDMQSTDDQVDNPQTQTENPEFGHLYDACYHNISIQDMNNKELRNYRASLREEMDPFLKMKHFSVKISVGGKVIDQCDNSIDFSENDDAKERTEKLQQIMRQLHEALSNVQDLQIGQGDDGALTNPPWIRGALSCNGQQIEFNKNAVFIITIQIDEVTQRHQFSFADAEIMNIIDDYGDFEKQTIKNSYTSTQSLPEFFRETLEGEMDTCFEILMQRYNEIHPNHEIERQIKNIEEEIHNRRVNKGQHF